MGVRNALAPSCEPADLFCLDLDLRRALTRVPTPLCRLCAGLSLCKDTSRKPCSLTSGKLAVRSNAWPCLHNCIVLIPMRLFAAIVFNACDTFQLVGRIW
eukprot:1360090-Amphidinium_carterae.3